MMVAAAVLPSQSPIQRKGDNTEAWLLSPLQLHTKINSSNPFPSGSLKEWEALLFVRAYCASRLRMKPVDGSDKWPPALTLNRPFQLFCFQYCIYVIWIIVDCKIIPLWVVRHSQDTLI